MERTMQASCSFGAVAPFGAVATRTSSKSKGRRPLRVNATAWDPEGLFKAGPQTGLIERKLMGQAIEKDSKFAEKMAEFAKEDKLAKEKLREARVLPEYDDKLIEFFLETDATEMEFEVARCRPRLTPDFFATLDRLVGIERLSPQPDEDRLAELETLRDYLKEGLEAVETAVKVVAAPAERLKKLLESKDKKATLLDMAANNEIDQGFFNLLEQNIEGATAAGQTEAAEFMKKVMQAARRYAVTT